MESAIDNNSIRGIRVLIAEDNPIVAFDMQQSLTERGCVVVAMFETLPEALAQSPALTFDVAILSCQLQLCSVADLASQISARGLPCLFATARPRHALPVSLRSQPLLEKPFSAVGLASALAAVFASHPGVRRESAS